MLSIAAVLLLLITMIQMRLRMKGTFEGDVREDLRSRLRLTALMLSQAVRKPKSPQTRTIVFVNLVNYSVDVPFRIGRLRLHSKHFSQFRDVEIVSATGWVVHRSCGLAAVSSECNRMWFTGDYAHRDVVPCLGWTGNLGYVQLVAYDSAALHEAGSIMVRMVLLPLVALVGYVMGVFWLGWLAGLLTAACTAALGYGSVSVAGLIRQTRS